LTVLVWLAGLALVVLAGVGLWKGRQLMGQVRSKKRGEQRNAVWNMFYGLKWGNVSTNNYGYAPAPGTEPERHQKQMYAELLELLRVRNKLKPEMKILEVSCGRGGGLAHVVSIWPGQVDATGLDRSAHAVTACRTLHGDRKNIAFVEGDALALPFADKSFDVVINVEASNDYGNYAKFYGEVARVLKPGGAFLYADSRRAEIINRTMKKLKATGFTIDVRDITDNVLQACKEDGARRRGLIKQAPWLIQLLFPKELASYAALEGSKQYESFRTRFRHYLMVYAERK
jgi:ubiquinone/menaquinone biosynthesis C-methylase UbiE